MLISRPPGDSLIRLHTRVSAAHKCARAADTNTGPCPAGFKRIPSARWEKKSVLRSAKRVLGLGNVFLMFIAIAYAAGGM